MTPRCSVKKCAAHGSLSQVLKHVDGDARTYGCTGRAEVISTRWGFL